MFDELLLTVLLTSVPLILAATGELVVERSGVLNLGVEGMMLMGAVAAFGAASLSGNPYIGIVGGGLAGMAVAGVFALFVLGLATNQVATGLALTIFGPLEGFNKPDIRFKSVVLPEPESPKIS